jgi:hypothetical protein
MDSCLIEPVVVTIRPQQPEPRRAILADILVVLVDRRLALDRGTEFFARYPGLALLVIAGTDGEALARLRDGTVLALSVRPDDVHLAAQFLYFSWAWGFRLPTRRW